MARRADTHYEDSKEDLYQISLLIDQLKHDDVQLRTNACKNLPTIAAALGPERTRDELIPFIADSTDDDNDDVLCAIAEKLGELIQYVGGDEYLYRLLNPLEMLVCVEEVQVRETAIHSIEAIISQMSVEHVTKYFVPFLERLSAKDGFISRISASCLHHVVYNRMGELDKKHIKSLFYKLCQDDTPMVRREAAQNISKFTVNLKVQDIVSEVIPIFKALISDEQDSVRIQALSHCIPLYESVPAEYKISQLLPVVLNVVNDKAWRVRWTLANKLHELCAALGQEASYNSLGSVYESLLNDMEAEVRAAAASHVHKISRIINKDFFVQRIIPTVKHLASDVSEYVRASLASSIIEVTSVLGKEGTVDHILPLLLLLLRDENSEVRLNIISNLGNINNIIGVELLSQSLIPAIIQLSEDAKWRVRLAIIEHIPVLAAQVGKHFFNDKLSMLCMGWLGDEVYSIRRAAAENLLKLTELFGEEWTKEIVLPRLEILHSNSNYLHRVTSLYGMQVLCKVIAPSVSNQTILPLLLALSQDPVPNVRFITATTMATLHQSISKVNPSGASEIKSILNSLASNDKDGDVRYYALEALQCLQ